MPNCNPRALALSLAALLLAGCGTARPYDPAQVPAAQQQQTANVEHCLAKGRNAYHKPSDLVRCFIQAEVEFARAIHVGDPRLVDAFRRQMLDIGSRADARRINWDEMVHFMGEAEQNFENNLMAAYRQDQARRAAAGQAGATQAAAAAQPQPDCTPAAHPAGSMAAALDPNACRER